MCELDNLLASSVALRVLSASPCDGRTFWQQNAYAPAHSGQRTGKAIARAFPTAFATLACGRPIALAWSRHCACVLEPPVAFLLLRHKYWCAEGHANPALLDRLLFALITKRRQLLGWPAERAASQPTSRPSDSHCVHRLLI